MECTSCDSGIFTPRLGLGDKVGCGSGKQQYQWWESEANDEDNHKQSATISFNSQNLYRPKEDRIPHISRICFFSAKIVVITSFWVQEVWLVVKWGHVILHSNVEIS